MSEPMVCVIGTGGEIEITIDDNTQSFYANTVSIMSHPDDIHLQFGCISDPEAFKETCEKVRVPADFQVIIPSELIGKLVSALSNASEQELPLE